MRAPPTRLICVTFYSESAEKYFPVIAYLSGAWPNRKRARSHADYGDVSMRLKVSHILRKELRTKDAASSAINRISHIYSAASRNISNFRTKLHEQIPRGGRGDAYLRPGNNNKSCTQHHQVKVDIFV